MAGKQALLDQLRRDAAGGEGDASELELHKEAWRQDLSVLMGRVEAWLTDSQLEGKLHVEKRDLEILEDELEPYVVTSMTIVVRTRHPRKVFVTPRAMQVVGGVFAGADGKERRLVGARGRVDITCGASREILLRIIGDDGTTWRWLQRDAELTEDNFFTVLGEMIE